MIRLATEQDATQILAIYAPIIKDTVISFEEEIPTELEIQSRIKDISETHPWLVCEDRGEVIGYAYASAHHSRIAYQWSVNVSVYIQSQYRGMGVGKALYSSLFPMLVMQGFYNAYAGITLPNPASVGLHEAMGFKRVCVYERVGFKHGAWRDVGWWHLVLQPYVDSPKPPTIIKQLRASHTLEPMLAHGLQFLNR